MQKRVLGFVQKITSTLFRAAAATKPEISPHSFQLSKPLFQTPTRSFAKTIPLASEIETLCELTDEELEALTAEASKKPGAFSIQTPLQLQEKMIRDLHEEKIAAIDDGQAQIALDAVARQYPTLKTALLKIDLETDEMDSKIKSLLNLVTIENNPEAKPMVALLLPCNFFDKKEGKYGHFFTLYIDPKKGLFLVDNNGDKYERTFCERDFNKKDYSLQKSAILESIFRCVREDRDKFSFAKDSPIIVQNNERETYDQKTICGFAALNMVAILAKSENPTAFLERIDVLNKEERAELFSTTRILNAEEILPILERDLTQQMTPRTKAGSPYSTQLKKAAELKNEV